MKYTHVGSTRSKSATKSLGGVNLARIRRRATLTDACALRVALQSDAARPRRRRRRTAVRVVVVCLRRRRRRRRSLIIRVVIAVGAVRGTAVRRCADDRTRCGAGRCGCCLRRRGGGGRGGGGCSGARLLAPERTFRVAALVRFMAVVAVQCTFVIVCEVSGVIEARMCIEEKTKSMSLVRISEAHIPSHRPVPAFSV